MFGRGPFQCNDFVQQPVELCQLHRAELLFHPRVVGLHGARQPLDEFHPACRRFDHRAALVLRVARAPDQPVAFHARQNTGQARPEDERFARDAARLHRAVLAQHAQHAPLLVRQAVAAQAGPRVRHDGFARLQQQAREVAVLESGGHGAAN